MNREDRKRLKELGFEQNQYWAKQDGGNQEVWDKPNHNNDYGNMIRVVHYKKPPSDRRTLPWTVVDWRGEVTLMGHYGATLDEALAAWTASLLEGKP